MDPSFILPNRSFLSSDDQRATSDQRAGRYISELFARALFQGILNSDSPRLPGAPDVPARRLASSRRTQWLLHASPDSIREFPRWVPWRRSERRALQPSNDCTCCTTNGRHCIWLQWALPCFRCLFIGNRDCCYLKFDLWSEEYIRGRNSLPAGSSGAPSFSLCIPSG